MKDSKIFSGCIHRNILIRILLGFMTNKINYIEKQVGKLRKRAPSHGARTKNIP